MLIVFGNDTGTANTCYNCGKRNHDEGEICMGPSQELILSSYNFTRSVATYSFGGHFSPEIAVGRSVGRSVVYFTSILVCVRRWQRKVTRGGKVLACVRPRTLWALHCTACAAECDARYVAACDRGSLVYVHMLVFRLNSRAEVGGLFLLNLLKAKEASSLRV